MVRIGSVSLQIQASAEVERRKRKAEGSEVADEFRAKYFDDPVAFVLDCIRFPAGEEPAPYQLEALERLVSKKRYTIRGPHGLGKTALAAWAILWFALTRDGMDWKIPTLASAWRQLTKYLWPEIRKWARRLDWEVIGRAPLSKYELQLLSLKLETGEAFAMASDDFETIEGAHADQILYIYDESKRIQAETWDASEGAFSTGVAYWLAISTPGPPNGRFHDIHSRKTGYSDWAVRHVTLQEAIKAGRVSAEWAKARKAQWGEKSAVYQNRVLGEFAASDEDSVIPLAWIEAANERWLDWIEHDKPGEFLGTGVDVGQGGDPTVYADKYKVVVDPGDPEKKLEPIMGIAIDDLERSNTRNLMGVAGRIKAKINKGGWAIIDVIGIGAGVYNRCDEQGLDVFAFNASHKTSRTDESGEWGYKNRRAQAWWGCREMLGREWIALPPDDKLIGDLTAPTWREMSGGVIQIESKKEIKKRLHRSTDDGDSVVMVLDQVGGVLLF